MVQLMEVLILMLHGIGKVVQQLQIRWNINIQQFQQTGTTATGISVL